MTRINKQAVQQQVMQLTGISHDEYCLAQFDGAYAYLRHYLNGDMQGTEFLTHSQSFWQWWTLQWALRDEQFIAMHYACASKQVLQRLWKSLHKPHNIIGRLPQHVMDDSYSLMVSDVWKEFHQTQYTRHA